MPKVRVTIKLSGKKKTLSLSGINKFSADSFIKEDQHFLLLMNGVCLSFKSLKLEDNFKYIVDLYQNEGDEFFRSLRGCFCGLLWDKKQNKWLIFTNHLGDQKLYYSLAGENIIIGSQVIDVVQDRKAFNAGSSLSLIAAYQLLTYGYFEGEISIVHEVKRLTAGRYLLICNGQLAEKEYYNIDNQPHDGLTMSDCIDGVDEFFQKAIKAQFDKDLLYGYEHIAAMSGGLDCRMTNWVANKMGYNDITNYTFSQYGYLDMTLAHEMSTYLGHDWLFKSLDKGNYLKKIDEVVEVINGQTSFGSSAHGAAMAHIINFDKFGINHSGQLGDVTIGTYNPTNAYAPAKSIKAVSSRLLERCRLDLDSYKNAELANYRIRGFNGILTGNFVSQPFTETLSPFLDVDFLNFSLSIPVKYRAYHRLYKQWILKKYPDAASFKWESTNAKIADKYVVLRGKQVPVKHLLRFIYEGVMYNIGIPVNAGHSKKNMNPFEYWMNENEALRSVFFNYFNTHIDLLSDTLLKKDCRLMFENGSATEKMQVLTLLSVVKQMEL